MQFMSCYKIKRSFCNMNYGIPKTSVLCPISNDFHIFRYSPEVFYKKLLLKISQNSQENTRIGDSFFNKVWKPATLFSKDFNTGVFL